MEEKENTLANKSISGSNINDLQDSSESGNRSLRIILANQLNKAARSRFEKYFGNSAAHSMKSTSHYKNLRLNSASLSKAKFSEFFNNPISPVKDSNLFKSKSAKRKTELSKLFSSISYSQLNNLIPIHSEENLLNKNFKGTQIPSELTSKANFFIHSMANDREKLSLIENRRVSSSAAINCYTSIPDNALKNNKAVDNEKINASLLSDEFNRQIRLDASSFLATFHNMESEKMQEALQVVKQNFGKFLLSPELAQSLAYITQRCLSKEELINHLKSLNLVTSAMQPCYQNLIEYIRSICNSNLELQEIVLSKFESSHILKEVMLSKYGKNIVEFFINEFLQNFNQFRCKLYQLIESAFVDFSKKNYATFVVQTYLAKERTLSAMKVISDNIVTLTTCRNGVFVVISAIKSYKDKPLQYLLDRIIEVAEILSKDAYSSTLIEYVFSNHKHAATNFIRRKSKFFLGTITFI